MREQRVFRTGDIVTGIGMEDYRKNHGDINHIKVPLYGARVLDEFGDYYVVVSYLDKKYLCNSYDIIKNEDIQMYRHGGDIYDFRTDRFKGTINKEHSTFIDSDHIESFIAIDNFKIIKYWTKNGLLHKEDGPAMIEVEADRTTEFYYINGEQIKNIALYYIRVKNSTKKDKIKLSLRDIERLTGLPYNSIELKP
mgnify:CR=1 FL=1